MVRSSLPSPGGPESGGPGCAGLGTGMPPWRFNARGRPLACPAFAAHDEEIGGHRSIKFVLLAMERQRTAASPGWRTAGIRPAMSPVLARRLSDDPALPSGITLELVDSRQTANLARREADMALRHQPPESSDFYISKAGTFACAVYRRRGAERMRGSPIPTSKHTMRRRAGSSGR